jgi:hypothetical protein
LIASLSILSVFSTSVTTAQSVLFSENFNGLANGSQPPNWAHDSTWSVQNGVYSSSGSTTQTQAYYTGATFSDFEYQVLATGLPNCGQKPPVLALTFRMQNKQNGYWFWGDIDKLQIVKWVNGQPNYLTVNPPYNSKSIGQINPTGTFNMTIIANGSSLTAIWNSQYTITVQDSTYSSGYIGVGTYHCNAAFNNVLVTSLGPASTTTTSTTTSTTTPPTTTSSTTTSTSSTTTPTTTSTSSTSATTTTSTTALPPSIYSHSYRECASTSTCSLSVSLPANSWAFVFPSTGVKVGPSSDACSNTVPPPPIASVTSTSLTWTQRGLSLTNSCEFVNNSVYQNYAFQILGGEEWTTATTSAVTDTITVTANTAGVTGKEPYEIAFIVIVIQGTDLSFGLGTPCISEGWSQVPSCDITSGSGLVVSSEEALNGACAGPDFTILVNQGEFVQDIAAQYMLSPYTQTNLGVAFNQSCSDTNINNGNDIWIMTVDVVV